jgi:hypothetical protein
LLVDDRDGRIVAEVETEEDAKRLFEAWVGEHSWPPYLCLVEMHSHHSAIFGSDSSVKVRPLPHD